MNPHVLGLLTLASLSTIHARAQRIMGPDELPCPEGNATVRSITLHSDSACSSFLLCIDDRVRPHLHRTHTEHVFVVGGTAEMLLGDSTLSIKAGDTVMIPAGTPHAVTVTGGGTLRVISVQSPHFDGTDRVWLDAR